MQTAPEDCMPDVTGCSLTPHNNATVCADVKSSEIEQYLETGNENDDLCHFDIEQYACSSANISCDSYKEIFNRLNQALSLVPVELVLTITSSIEALIGIAPQNCLTVVFSGQVIISLRNFKIKVKVF
ncbi:hypothetical protein SKAU_G00129230 [Synaphobranchus kaupii]|uniref:Sox C-terminal domain-containing protein n=1 Tax=Synaphobranchus kaupii TaxID=118154 RepID=A0A9Q1FR19_SYNKA|nr:hypothetical protein SKAU_G00129230 [Synaphobranchus kaupii]